MDKVFTIGAARALALSLAAALAACALPGSLPTGTTLEAARRVWPSPVGEYSLPDGGKRLEFSLGKQTWMLDFGANGVLNSTRQVLTDSNFADITPGMTADEVRLRLGHPWTVFGAGWQDRLQVWSYRFVRGDCVLFQVTLRDTDHKVKEAGIGPDLACGGPNPRDHRP